MLDKNNFFICPSCKGKKFKLIQHEKNVKIRCCSCHEITIIYWNGLNDADNGSMRRLDTLAWIKK